MPSWNWNESQSESGVVHQSVANTDNNDSTVLKQGYDYANFSEITPTPVACWPLHENSGSTAYDLAGTNNGTYNGPTLGQTGLLGTTAPSLDGTDDNIVVPDSDEFSIFAPGSGGTITGWVYLNSEVSGVKMIEKNQEWAIRPTDVTSSSGSVGLRVDLFGDNTGPQISDSDLQVGEWTFIAIRLDPGNSVDYIRNGSEVYSYSTTDTSSNTTNDVYIGQSGSNTEYFPGRLWDVRIWNTLLSNTNLQTLYDVVATTGAWTGTQKLL